MSRNRMKQHVTSTLRTIFENGPQTAYSAGVSIVEMRRLEAEGVVRRKAVVRKPQRGRPAIVWTLSDKGRKRVKRALA